MTRQESKKSQMGEEITTEETLAIVLLVLIVILLVAVIILARFMRQLARVIHKLNSRGHTMSFRSSPKDMEIMQKESATPGLFRQLPIWLQEGSKDPKVTGSQVKLRPIPNQFSNIGFCPEITRNSIARDSVSDNSQPVYGIEVVLSDEISSGNNNHQIIKEPISQIAGELAVSNNPERERAYTMNISDLR